MNIPIALMLSILAAVIARGESADLQDAKLSSTALAGLREYRENELNRGSFEVGRIETSDELADLFGAEPVAWPADWTVLGTGPKHNIVAVPARHIQRVTLPTGHVADDGDRCMLDGAIKFSWGGMIVSPALEDQKSYLKKVIEVLGRRLDIPEVTVQAAKEIVSSKTHLSILHEEMDWRQRTVNWDSVAPEEALYLAVLPSASLTIANVTRCTEWSNGARTVLCYSGDTLEDSIAVAFFVFENGERLYAVTASLSTSEERRREHPEGRAALKGIAASALHFGLGAERPDSHEVE